jgi:hypothetical protein
MDDEPEKTESVTPTRRKKPKAKPKEERGQSTLAFPYQDLDSAIAVARAIHDAGALPVTRDQLAGVMKLAAGGGNFVVKVAAARVFGLITYTGNKYELTPLGFSILDASRQRSARMDAFLSVPLYRRAYDEWKGKQLPPRPHGLEQAFVRFGIAPKQRTNARLIFDKSATQAGFFPNGPDRLIEPIIGAAPLQERNRELEEIEGNGGSGKSTTGRQETQSASDTGGGRHPFIQGLLQTLPEPGTNWAIEGRAKWLQAAAHCFDLIYNGSGEIHIAAKVSHEPAADLATNKPTGPEPVRS